jgi:flavin-dependent dehydrogenase
VSQPDVVIVGGGPAGASTAWVLARAGVRVLLLDRARFPRDKPCAEYLSPQASRVLADMGALEACERAGGAQLAGMIVRSPGGATLRGDFADVHGFRGFRDRGLALPRRVLDTILLDRARAAGACVEEGVRATDVLHDAHGRAIGVCTLEPDGAKGTRMARFVVAADGLRSTIARRLRLAHTARAPRRIAFITHYRGVAEVGAYGEMHVEDDGYLGIADVGQGVANVAVVVPARRARAAAGDPAGFMESWIAARTHVVGRFARATRTGPVWATGPFASRARRSWVPGLALVGDAHDFFDPFTGEGIYNALRGGELLGASLIQALGANDPSGASAALAGYAAARRREFGAKSRVERLIGLAIEHPAIMNRLAGAMQERKELADLLVGVAGDFVPARQVLSFRYVGRLALAAMRAPPRMPELADPESVPAPFT